MPSTRDAGTKIPAISIPSFIAPDMLYLIGSLLRIDGDAGGGEGINLKCPCLLSCHPRGIHRHPWQGDPGNIRFPGDQPVDDLGRNQTADRVALIIAK